MGAAVTGRNAETVYRDKQSGKRVEGGAAELEALEESRKKPKSEAPAWGGGIAQVGIPPYPAYDITAVAMGRLNRLKCHVALVTSEVLVVTAHLVLHLRACKKRRIVET